LFRDELEAHYAELGKSAGLDSNSDNYIRGKIAGIRLLKDLDHETLIEELAND